MNTKDEEFQKRLLVMFREEAREHLDSITKGLLDLEKEVPTDEKKEIIERVYRETHSLKGAARAVSLSRVEGLCQNLESVFSALKRGETTIDSSSFDLLHKVVDNLSKIISPDDLPVDERDIEQLISNLKNLLLVQSQKPAEDQKKNIETGSTGDNIEKPVEIKESEPLLSRGTVRVATWKLDSLFSKTDELIMWRLAQGQMVADLKDLNIRFQEWFWNYSKINSQFLKLKQSLETRSDDNRNEGFTSDLLRLTEFLDYNRNFIDTIERRTRTLTENATKENFGLYEFTESIREEVKRTLLLPASVILDNYQKFVRTFSREKGKEAELISSGAEIEVDRRVLDELKDPLLHLIRNSIDHGIENEKERLQAGKSKKGRIKINLSSVAGNRFTITYEDDGRGIDLEAVKNSGLKNGIFSEDQLDKLTESEILTSIFYSGLSTSQIITDTSGRGLGLAIVLEKVEALGGYIDVSSEKGKSTRFEITLPLTIATFRGVLVRAGKLRYAIPIRNIKRVFMAKTTEIETIENRSVIRINGVHLSIIPLEQVLYDKTGNEDDKPDSFPAIYLHDHGNEILLQVDEVLASIEVLVKTLGPQLKHLEGVAGATILGNGSVIPVLRIDEIIESAIKTDFSVTAESGRKDTDKKAPNILVAEDSITSRMLLKNILEGAGYKVETAVDGVDAFSKIKTGQFDVLVSDVDMPRMNGFTLTEKVRADPKNSDIPVILVTALESQEDKEHGIEAGANAYIVKSSFDQSNLLEVISRLL